MRRIATVLAVAAALAVPAAPANAYYCGETLDDACRLVCEVALDGRCPR